MKFKLENQTLEQRSAVKGLKLEKEASNKTIKNLQETSTAQIKATKNMVIKERKHAKRIKWWNKKKSFVPLIQTHLPPLLLSYSVDLFE